MDTTWKVVEADRDSQGKIKVQSDEPRSLSDLLPKVEPPKMAAQRAPYKLTRREMALLGVVALLCVYIIAQAAGAAPERVSAPVARPTIIATPAPTTAPTAPPTATPAATIVPTDEPASEVAPVVEQPAAAPPPPCTQNIAPYVLHQQVKDGTLPLGEYTVWSCTSQADAEQQAQAAEAQIRATAAAR